jgi:hypothetical protein
LARAQWVADRRADLVPVPYVHVVFTVSEPIAAIAHVRLHPAMIQQRLQE